MSTWHIMRSAAYARHCFVWAACGCNPVTWPLHVALIRAVYGY